MIFTDTYFAEDVSKVSPENISFLPAKSKRICPKVLKINVSDYYILPT